MDNSDGGGAQKRPRASFEVLVEVALEQLHGSDTKDVHGFGSRRERDAFMNESHHGSAPEIGGEPVRCSRRGGISLSDEGEAALTALQNKAGVENQGGQAVVRWEISEPHMRWVEGILDMRGVTYRIVDTLPASGSLEAVLLVRPPVMDNMQHTRVPNVIQMTPAARVNIALTLPHGRRSDQNNQTWQDAMNGAQTERERRVVEQKVIRAFNKRMQGLGYHIREGTSVTALQFKEDPHAEIQYIITCQTWNRNARACARNGGFRRVLAQFV